MSKGLPILAGALLCGAAAAAAAADNTPLAQCAAVDDPAARLACYDALAGRLAAAPVEAPTAAPSVADFGIPRAQAAPEEAPSLTARIVGSFKNWQKGTRVRLDNGQVWKVTGDSRINDDKVPDDAQVTITHGIFGGYWMEIHPIGRKIKVKRVQ